MKLKKFIAILIITAMFASFFSLGAVLSQKIQATNTTECTQEKIEVPIYITNTTVKSAVVYGVGVHEDNETGELVEFNITSVEGSGRTFFDTTFHQFGTDMQSTMPVILTAVQRYTKKSFDSQDITVTVHSLAEQLEGTSGSAAVGVALVAIQLNKTVEENTIITGTLDERGNIGAIAGLDIKIKVASSMGIERILIPKSECRDYNVTGTIQVTCVATLKEAAEQMLI